MPKTNGTEPQIDMNNAIFNTLQEAGRFSPEDLKNLLLVEKEKDLQIGLAPSLRHLAINHLEKADNAQSPYARNFRAAYNDCKGEENTPLDAYLYHLGQENVWATYVEAGALGELLDITVVITTIKDKCDLFLLLELPINKLHSANPEDKKPFINNYILVGNDLYYIKYNGQHDKVTTIEDINKFKQTFNIQKESVKIELTNDLILASKYQLLQRGIEQTPMVARKAADSSRPIIHLYNKSNVHWYLYSGQPENTVGDGNCLYNAFAQFLRQYFQYENVRNNNQEQDLHEVSEEYRKIYESQEQLWGEIKDLPATPIKELMQRIKVSISDQELASHQAAMEIVIKKADTTKRLPDPQDTTNTEAQTRVQDKSKGQDLDAKASNPNQLLQNNLNALKNLKLTGEAGKTANQLVLILQGSYRSYAGRKIKYDQFKQESMKAIENSRKVLESRGCAEILKNIGLAIALLGVGYALAGTVNWYKTGRFFFFPTETAKLLDKTVISIKSMKQPGGQ